MARTAQKNPWIGINYLPNDVAADTPPAFFLQRIYDFDNMLVLMPSKRIPFAYVIARRRQFGRGLSDKAIEDSITVSDTRTCLAHGLVPVCLMYRTGFRWDPDPIIRSLKARDMWQYGNTSEERANRIADMLEEQEAAEKKQQLAAIREEFWHRSGDAYRSYKHRTGQRSGRSGTIAQAGRRDVNSPSSSGRTAGSGALFVGA